MTKTKKTNDEGYQPKRGKGFGYQPSKPTKKIPKPADIRTGIVKPKKED